MIKTMRLPLFILGATLTSCLATPVDNGFGPVGRPVPSVTLHRAGTPSSEGIHDGFYYSWWSDQQGQALYTNKEGGSYSVEWTGDGNFVGGKGWKPGVYDREITYKGDFHPKGNGYLAVYGWTRSPTAEWYIADSFGTYNPASGGTKKGSVTCNGAQYDIVEVVRNGWEIGNSIMRTFWSIRNPKQTPGGTQTPGGNVSGTVDTACHFDAWKEVGLKFGTDIAYQIVATEGYWSSGNSTITVSSN
ncbi:xylanase [Coprinopsis sp. MPI-PUGE-AT-0042]|nr:xylanase [Coprinopsis sp. MPI-PUGE-AT-0042]KAH6910587.1 xylanase [Coprinopsis sp. MPI-PUGE-AT-0042]